MASIIDKLLADKSDKFDEVETKIFGTKPQRPEISINNDNGGEYDDSNGHYDEWPQRGLEQNAQLDMFRKRDIDPMASYRTPEVDEAHLRLLAKLQAESLFLKLELKTTIPKAVMMEALTYVGATEQAEVLGQTTTSLSFEDFRGLIQDVIYFEFIQLQREGRLRIPPAQELVNQLMQNAFASIAGKNGENVIILIKKGFEKAGLNFMK